MVCSVAWTQMWRRNVVGSSYDVAFNDGRSVKTRTIILVIFLFGLASISFAQQDTTWNRWSWLIGDWIGEGNGAPRQGTGWFSSYPDLDGKILLRKSHSEYPATENKPEIIHNDLMVVYLDDSNSPNKASYFDNEGHTINYMISCSGTSIVFTSIKTQKAPIFRLTYIPLDKETVDVKFEMSKDGAKFLTYTEGKCKRKK